MKSFKHLISLLEKEIKLFTELDEIIDEERHAIMSFHIEKIEQIILKKEQIFIKIKKGEETRKKAIEGITHKLGIDGKSMTLLKLSQYNNALNKELKDIRARLTSIRDLIIGKNRINGLLINNFLSHINDTNRFFMTYGDSPEKKSKLSFQI